MRESSSRLIYYLTGALVAVIIASVLLNRMATRRGAAAALSGAESPVRSAVEASSSSLGTGAAGESAEGGDSTDQAPAAGEQAVSDAIADAGDASFRAIPIPPDFFSAFENDQELAEFHARLEREPEDAEWALRLEQYLEDHFNSTLDLSEFSVLSLECRSKSCEILAVGYDDDALRGWMASVSELLQNEEEFEALVGGRGNGQCGGGTLAPGMMTLTCSFERIDSDQSEDLPAEIFSLDAPYPEGTVAETVNVSDPAVPVIESNGELYDLHRRLELEATDHSWSNYIEPLITEYMAELESANGLTVLDVVCRTTLCEVQMSAADDGSFINWLPDMLNFQRQDWHDLGTAALDGNEVIEGEPGGVVWILERRQGD